MSDLHSQQGNGDPEAGATPPPSERLPRAPVAAKPPREWRVSRTIEARATPAPRVVRSVAAAEAQPPAGSHAPTIDSPPSSGNLVPPPASWQPHAPAPSTLGADALPGRYGVDRLVLLVRDPYWVYAWWELTDASLAAGRRELAADADLVLRVYDVSGIDWDGINHHSHFDIDVADLAGNWYIELGKPGASFVGEIGLRAHDGRFLALLRSNFVTLPRDSMSDVVDEEWMVVEADYRLLFNLAGGDSIGLGSGEIQRMLEQRLRSELASGGVSSFGLTSPGVRERKP